MVAFAAEMFARQLLARLALRIAEELQRPPRRFDQPGGVGVTQYTSYMAPKAKLYSTSQSWLPTPLQILKALSKHSQSRGWAGYNANITDD